MQYIVLRNNCHFQSFKLLLATLLYLKSLNKLFYFVVTLIAVVHVLSILFILSNIANPEMVNQFKHGSECKNKTNKLSVKLHTVNYKCIYEWVMHWPHMIDESFPFFSSQWTIDMFFKNSLCYVDSPLRFCLMLTCICLGMADIVRLYIRVYMSLPIYIQCWRQIEVRVIQLHPVN